MVSNRFRSCLKIPISLNPDCKRAGLPFDQKITHDFKSFENQECIDVQHSTESEKKLDILEHGAPVDGVPQTSDRRLYMQLQVFTGVGDVDAVSEVLNQSGLDFALYLDAQDPCGIGIVFLAESPDLFCDGYPRVAQ